MAESTHDHLRALGELIERFPDGGLPGPAIGRDGGDSPAPEPAAEPRWAELEDELPPVAGRRALALGAHAVEIAGRYAGRGAAEAHALVATESADGGAPPASNGGGSIHLRALDWRHLDPAQEDAFDLVHCEGLLHACPDPLALLFTLRRMTAPDGALVLGATMLADPERSEYLRFVPQAGAAPRGWYFVPGRLAARWMLHGAGFEVVTELAPRDGERDGLRIVEAHLIARVGEY